jgi:FkbM family methyltransferase
MPVSLPQHPLDEPLRLTWALRALRKLHFPRKLGICERLFGKTLSASGVKWVETSNGLVWKLDLADASHRWCVYGDYEGAAQMNSIRRWLSGGGDVIDSGANIGQMTLYFALAVGCTVHAFEPTHGARSWLASCIDRNALRNVRIVGAGLSGHAASVPIQLDGARSTMHLDWYAGKNLKTEQIEVIRLDDYAAEQGIERIRFWKLDTEGHELEGLLGASRLLASRRIDVILVEVRQANLAPIRDYLLRFGYKLYRQQGSRITLFDGQVLAGHANLIARPGAPMQS